MKQQPNDICFTQGAQQGIFTCLQILTKENDYVLHEELTYPGFHRAVEANGVKPLSVPSHCRRVRFNNIRKLL